MRGRVDELQERPQTFFGFVDGNTRYNAYEYVISDGDVHLMRMVIEFAVVHLLIEFKSDKVSCSGNHVVETRIKLISCCY
jgi:hypothetical protein